MNEWYSIIIIASKYDVMSLASANTVLSMFIFKTYTQTHILHTYIYNKYLPCYMHYMIRIGLLISRVQRVFFSLLFVFFTYESLNAQISYNATVKDTCFEVEHVSPVQIKLFSEDKINRFIIIFNIMFHIH